MGRTLFESGNEFSSGNIYEHKQERAPACHDNQTFLSRIIKEMLSIGPRRTTNNFN